MNILKTYQNIFADESKWKYYSRIDSSAFTIERILSSDIKASNFIHTYFEQGDKSHVFFMDEQKMSHRWVHSISTFFLGIYIYNELFVPIIEDDVPYNKFLYGWFITCLCHDYGYIIENEKNPNLLKKSIKQLFQHYSQNKENKYYLLSTKGEFSNKTRKEYFDYCRTKLGFINHGIIGGLLLYSHLATHLESKWKEHKKNIFVENNLSYSLDQKFDFEQCANAIIAHNIWFSPNSTIDELRLDGKKHIYKHWLTALLVLCDTIEPLKAFPCCNPLHLLQCLSIDVVRDSISITYDCPDEHICFDKYISHCKSLNDWTNIQTCYIQHGIQLSNVSALLKTK